MFIVSDHDLYVLVGNRIHAAVTCDVKFFIIVSKIASWGLGASYPVNLDHCGRAPKVSNNFQADKYFIDRILLTAASKCATCKQHLGGSETFVSEPKSKGLARK